MVNWKLQNDVFEERDGKSKVLRKFGRKGLQNAFHIAVHQPVEEIFKFLDSHDVDPDTDDYDLQTPFLLLARTYNYSAT